MQGEEDEGWLRTGDGQVARRCRRVSDILIRNRRGGLWTLVAALDPARWVWTEPRRTRIPGSRWCRWSPPRSSSRWWSGTAAGRSAEAAAGPFRTDYTRPGRRRRRRPERAVDAAS